MRKLAICLLLLGCGEGEFTARAAVTSAGAGGDAAELGGAAQGGAPAAGAPSAGSAGVVHAGASDGGRFAAASGAGGLAGAGGRPESSAGAGGDAGSPAAGAAGSPGAHGDAGAAGAPPNPYEPSCWDTSEEREAICGATTGNGPCGAEWTCVSELECLAAGGAACGLSACVDQLARRGC